AAMERHVGTYFDEWRATLEDPEKLERFRTFVNAPDVPDPHITFGTQRDQIVPTATDGPVLPGASIPVGAGTGAGGARCVRRVPWVPAPWTGVQRRVPTCP